MLKRATVRVPDDFYKELGQFIEEMKLDRSAYLRDILKRGFEEDKRERILAKYHNAELSLSEACKKLNLAPWDFFELLKSRNLRLNVDLEDWLDSAGLEISGNIR